MFVLGYPIYLSNTPNTYRDKYLSARVSSIISRPREPFPRVCSRAGVSIRGGFTSRTRPKLRESLNFAGGG